MPDNGGKELNSEEDLVQDKSDGDADEFCDFFEYYIDDEMFDALLENTLIQTN